MSIEIYFKKFVFEEGIEKQKLEEEVELKENPF